MKRNVTLVAGRHRAGSIDVCRVGNEVAVHIGTPGGCHIFTMPAHVFVAGARSERDYNGNPWSDVPVATPATKAEQSSAGETPMPRNPAPSEITRRVVRKPGGKLL